MDEYVNLENLAGGRAAERFGLALQDVIANIKDPNTDPKAVREIILKAKFKPSANRESASVQIQCTRKLADLTAVETTFYLGLVQGEPVAQEHNPRQLRFDAVLEAATDEGKGKVA